MATRRGQASLCDVVMSVLADLPPWVLVIQKKRRKAEESWLSVR